MKPWIKTVLLMLACFITVNTIVFLIASVILYLGGWRP